jgi:hypothetical protein
VEAFDLAVGLGPVGAGAFVGDVGVGERAGPVTGAIAGAVVGQCSFDVDAVGGEPGVRSFPERCGGRALLVVEDLGVGETGAVIERSVQVAVAGAGSFGGWCVASAVDLPTTPFGDPTELFDIDVDQLARPIALIALRLLRGGAVAAIEPAHALRAQDRLHGRCREPGFVRDVISTPAMLTSELEHFGSQLRSGLVR